MGGADRNRPTGDGTSVSRLELFLDLIFVFAFLNVTGVTAEQLNPAGLPRGLVLLLLLWWCWVQYAWLGVAVRLDRGRVPIAIFGLSAVLFVLTLTVREAFVDRSGGLSGPVVFAVCYLVVRAGPLVIAATMLTGDARIRRNLGRAWPPALVAALFLLAAALVPAHVPGTEAREWVRFGLVGCAILVEYGTAALIVTVRWRIRSVSYWAERHGLIILVGFGETIISVGSSQGVAVALPLTGGVIAGVLLAVVLAGTLWWAYFDIARFAAEHALSRVSSARQAVVGRDAYSLLHLPMMVGLIMVALGLKKALGELRAPADETSGLVILTLYGGVALYLVGLLLFEIRTLRLVGRSPLLGIILVAVTAPVASRVPVLVELALLAAATAAMAVADVTVFRRRHRELHRSVEAMHERAEAAPKELFFDLVFVFAFLQVAALMADDPTVTGVARGLLVLTLLWLAWSAYSGLGTVVRAESPQVRLAMLLVVGMIMVITLAAPQAFNATLGGLSGPLVFLVCYALIRLTHLGASWLVARRDPGTPGMPAVAVLPTLVALGLLLVAALVPQPAGDIRPLSPVQAGLWLAAIVVDLVGNGRLASRHLRIGSPRHWADRYALIVIIGLGEAVISMGSAVVYTPISARIVVAVLFGTALLACLWWIYFSLDAREGEHALAAATGADRRRLARDAYSYLHLPLIAGIVLVSLGLRKTMSVLGSAGFFGFGAPLYPLAHAALFGGVLLYLIVHQVIRRRLTHRWSPVRLCQALVVAALLPLTARLPALIALGVLATACVGFAAWDAGRGRWPLASRVAARLSR